jgi:hypothetical protein
MNLPKAKPKIAFDIGCDQLAPSMAIVLFIHALHFAKAYDESEATMEFEQDIPIKSNRRELDFLKRYLIMI